MTKQKEETETAPTPKYELITGVEKRPRKVIIYGTPCIGKTSFAEQFPDPIIIQTENAGGSIVCPRLPICKTYEMFYEQIVGVGQGEYGEFKTIVIDSLKFLEVLFSRHICNNLGLDGLGDDADYGKSPSYSQAMCMWYDLTDMLDRFIEKGMDVVLIAHPRTRLVKDSMVDEYETTTLDLVKWGLYDPTKMFVCWSDCILYLTHKIYTKSTKTGIDNVRVTAMGDGTRIMYTEERPAFLAKNRFKMPPELPFIEGQGYSAIEKYLNMDRD